MSRIRGLIASFACALVVVGVPVVAQARTLYVPTGANTVATLDTATNTAGAVLTFPNTSRPWAAAVSPNGASAYILDSALATVTPVAVATGTLGTPIAIPGGNSPEDIAITPNGATAYVANTNGNTVVPINLATNTAGTPITLPTNSAPYSVAITPDGKTAYVADYGTNSVTAINTATNTAGGPLPVGATPKYIAITPNGKTAYVANDTAAWVTPIDIASNTVGLPIVLPTGSRPQAIAITPDGATAYVADFGTDSVTPINLASNTAGPAIALPAGSGPVGVAITPDGKTVYVSNNSAGTLTPISTATNKAGTPVLTVTAPGLSAIVPDQGPSAAFTATASGASVSFNASGTADPDGSVASYSWSFGDGITATSSAPTITHTYATSGNYSATLTVTDNEGCSTTVVFTGHTVSCNGSRAAQTAHVISLSTLSVSLAGSGTGKVTGVGISCPGTCAERLMTGSVVILTATPAPGSTFAGWSGGGCKSSRSCSVTVAASTLVTATFNKPPRCTLTVKRNQVRLARPKPAHGSKSRASIGTLSLSVTCNQAAAVKLTGVLTELLGHKPKPGKQKTKTFRLGPVRGSLRAGVRHTLTPQLPDGALSGLKSKARESVALTLIATNANGMYRARATIASLKGVP